MVDVSLIILIFTIFIIALIIVNLSVMLKSNKDNLNKLTRELNTLNNITQEKIEGNNNKIIENMHKSNLQLRMELDNKFSQLNQTNNNFNTNLFNRVDTLSKVFEDRFEKLQISNENKLKEIQNTVDKQLQDILQKRINESFSKVNEHLQSVQQGLGEMKNLANDVGGLKNALTNVKTTGIIGEVQLSRILEQALNKNFYLEQAKIFGNNDIVDFAIKLPGANNDMEKPLYLPIDAKFPMERYQRLLNAFDEGDGKKIKEAKADLASAIKKEAKSISEKYIKPPITTDFAIIFFPAEGLYAEVVSDIQLMEDLTTKYKINVAGPSTIMAYLNSLQMGFKTLAIESRTSEVWQTLEAVKKEFSNYSDAIEKVHNKIKQADNEIEKLITTRTNAVNSKLKNFDDIELNVALDRLELKE